jgi:protein O-mannosyl-transferase
MKKHYYLFVILIFAFLLYGNTIPNEYALDDLYVTGDNPQITRGVEGIPEIFTSFYTEINDVKFAYRPIVKVSFAIEYELFGKNPHVSHFINVLLYGLGGVLLFLLLSKKMFLRQQKFFSFLIVLLFMAHPVHTEVVASLKNRDELLSFLFSIGSVYLAFIYFDRKNLLFLLLSALSFFIAYLSKPSALVFVALIPLCLYFFRDIKSRKLLLIFLSILVFAVIARYLPKWILTEGNRGYHFIENPLVEGAGLLKALGTGMTSLWFYLKMLVYPYPLLFYYGYDTIPVVGIMNPIAILSLVVHLSLFIFALANLKKKSVLSFAILFYFISISMFSNIVKPAMGIVAERYMFTAILGFSVALVFLLYKLFERKLKPDSILPSYKTVAIFLLILMPFSVLSINRNFNWKDEISLYKHDIKHLENSAKANDLLAGTLFAEVKKQKNISPNVLKVKAEEIIFYYKKAIKVYPEFDNAWNNLGSVYFELLKDYEKANLCFYQAVRLNPSYMKAVFNYAHCSDIMNMPDTAEKYYSIVIKNNSKHKTAWSLLANLYFRQGKLKAAIKTNEMMMEKLPDSDIPYVNIGKYYLTTNDTLLAIPYLEKAILKRPDNYNLSVNLFNYFRMKGLKEKADYYYKLAEKYKRR